MEKNKGKRSGRQGQGDANENDRAAGQRGKHESGHGESGGGATRNQAVPLSDGPGGRAMVPPDCCNPMAPGGTEDGFAQSLACVARLNDPP